MAPAAGVHPILQLQRAAGNHSVDRLLQATLSVSEPGDACEQEAETVARATERMSEPAAIVAPNDALSSVPAVQRRTSVAAAAHESPRRPDEPSGTSSAALARHGSPASLTSAPAFPFDRPGADAAPPIVHDGRHSPGQPLDAATRAYMEPRLGHDFSRVRVHTDATAARSARAVNALAYTVGKDIVFGAGQYAPGVQSGRRLIAHELSHVTQQSNQPTRVIQRQAAGQAVRPATHAERREFQGDQRRFVVGAIDFLQAGGELYRTGGRVDGAILRRQLTSWKRTLEGAVEIIRAGLNNDPTLLQGLRQAYEGAVRAIIAAVVRQGQRTSHDLYQAQRENIHEWAWPQAVADPAGSALSDALTENERRRIRVVTTGVTIGDVHDLFSTQGGTTTIGLPQGATVRFSGAAPARLHHGLQNVAGELTRHMTPPPLELNSTITLALDLERYGGDYAAYRFTYVEHRPRQGQPTREILIERLGSIGMEGLSPSQSQAAGQRFAQHRFRRGSGWGDREFQSVLAAIAQIPDAMLTQVDGLRFDRGRASATDPEAGGDYNPQTHVIRMYDRGFTASMTRTGAPGPDFADETVRSVRHEIGHALDLVPLHQIWDRLEQASQTRHAAFAQYESPAGSNNYQFPSTEQARWNTLSQQVAAAEQARDQARSRSGYRWQQNAQTSVFESVQGGTAAGNNAFRQAAQQDGGARITRYSDKEWGEFFAESYSLYITAPETLRRLRPHVFEYFARTLPR